MTKLLATTVAIALLASPALAAPTWSQFAPEQFTNSLVAECARLHPGSPDDAKTCRADEFHAQLSVSQMILAAEGGEETGDKAEAACAPGSGIALIPGSDPPMALPSLTAACLAEVLGVPVPPYTDTPLNMRDMVEGYIQRADVIAAGK